MDNHYGGVIWTNHALDRLRERGIKQGDAWATWNRPEQSYKANNYRGSDAWRYYRAWGSQRIEVVAKQNEKKEWIIISVWSEPLVRTTKHLETTSFWRSLYNFIFGR